MQCDYFLDPYSCTLGYEMYFKKLFLACISIFVGYDILHIPPHNVYETNILSENYYKLEIYLYIQIRYYNFSL